MPHFACPLSGTSMVGRGHIRCCDVEYCSGATSTVENDATLTRACWPYPNAEFAVDMSRLCKRRVDSRFGDARYSAVLLNWIVFGSRTPFLKKAKAPTYGEHDSLVEMMPRTDYS